MAGQSVKSTAIGNATPERARRASGWRALPLGFIAALWALSIAIATTAQAGCTTSTTNVTSSLASTPFNASAQSLTLSATVNSTGNNFNSPPACSRVAGTGVTDGQVGQVVFTVRNASLAVIGSAVTDTTALTGAFSVTYSLPGGTPVGTYTITAAYTATGTGNNENGPSSATGTFEVTAAPPDHHNAVSADRRYRCYTLQHHPGGNRWHNTL